MLALKRILVGSMVIWGIAALGCAEDPVTPGDKTPPLIVDSPEKVIQALEIAYRDRDLELYESLLANDHDNNAVFAFLLTQPTQQGDEQWDYETEMYIHRRMFEPHNKLDQEPVVPDELWLQSIDISLKRMTDFSERTVLYSADEGADGLLAQSKWRATSALYSTNVFFQMRGEIDYQINGEAEFVVIEDLAKEVGDADKFLLFIWEDLVVPLKSTDPHA